MTSVWRGLYPRGANRSLREHRPLSTPGSAEAWLAARAAAVGAPFDWLAARAVAVGANPVARAVLAALVAAASIAVAPASALACSCAERTIEESIASATAIFEAQVASIEEAEVVAGAEGPPMRDRLVHLDVVQTWRGANAEHVVVRTAGDSAACGFTFEVGASYLVYAGGSAERLTVSACSRTRGMTDADEDRAVLGSGVVPVDVTDEDTAPEAPATVPRRGGGCAGCSASGPRTGGSWGLVGLALAAWIGARRNR